MVRQLVGARVELAIGQLLVLEHHRHGIGGARGLLFEQLVDAAILRVVGRRVVPFDQQLLAFRLGEQRQLADALLADRPRSPRAMP